MTKERLILLDTILSEGNVDIGRLIAREIYTCISKKKGFLFFPCLITELCMKAAVPIAENEHTKFLSNNLNAVMKERLKKVREPQPMPMPMPMPAMQEIFMQKQAAVWKFQKEQHDWLQLVFHYMSTELGNIEAPVFPSWVLRTESKEDEEKEEDEEKKEEEKEETDEKEEEKEEEEEEESKLRKRVTRKQVKGKKKIVVEPDMEETYDSDSEENLELEKELDKQSEEEEEESDEPGSEEEERARSVILEEIERQKYTKTSPQTQQRTTHTSPTKSSTKSPTESPITSPTKEPSPPSNSPPHSPPPPSPTKPDQPMPQSPSIITANVISDLEKEIVQDREEEGLDREEESEAVAEPEAEAEPEAVQTDAPASGASASHMTATTKHDEATIKLVLEEMAKSKKEELGNTQKFFKTPALKKQAAKRKISEAISTDATASVPAATTEETGASAPTEETPTKPSKEKKQRVKHTAPTRQSSRTRSGAKK